MIFKDNFLDVIRGGGGRKKNFFLEDMVHIRGGVDPLTASDKMSKYLACHKKTFFFIKTVFLYYQCPSLVCVQVLIE